MLKLVRDEGTPRTPLSLGDLPLGPWAETTLQVWATKTGTRWHADPECRSLKTRVRSEEFVQPASGTLADRKLPEGLHCDPPGMLGDYLDAASRLVRLSNETDAAEDEWDHGNIPVRSLRPGLRWGNLRVLELLATEPLASVAAAETRRHEELVEKVCRFVAVNDERPALMVLADWVRRGRTPREHKPSYDQFVETTAGLFDAADITTYMGMRSSINRDSLPRGPR